METNDDDGQCCGDSNESPQLATQNKIKYLKSLQRVVKVAPRWADMEATRDGSRGETAQASGP
jgi:hypothetical protein